MMGVRGLLVADPKWTAILIGGSWGVCVMRDLGREMPRLHPYS